MKKKESFDFNWLKPNKLNIIFSILIFFVFMFSIIGACMTMKGFEICLNYLFKDYLIIIGFILISYFLASYDLGGRLSFIAKWNLKNKIYWIFFIPVFLLLLYLIFAYALGFWPFCRFVRISGGFMNTCSGLILPM